MDPLSISASIAGLLALTSSVVQYLSAVGDSETRSKLLLEVTSASGLLYSLKDLCQQSHMPAGCFISLKSLCTPQGPFDQFKKALELLDRKLAPVHGRDKVKRALTWFFNQDEVKSLMDVMERQKTYFLLALQGNHLVLSQELARSMTGMAGEIQKVQEAIHNLGLEQNQQRFRQLQQHELDVFAWLSSTTFADRQSTVLEKIQPGTCLWLLRHDNFVQWIGSSVSSSILWLPGIPGSGKTCLAAFAIDYLERNFTRSDIGVAYIFCDYKDTAQTVERIKRVILRQLLRRLDYLPEEVDKLYQLHARRSTEPTSSELDDVLLAIANLFSRVFIVIDALDEASANSDVTEALLKLSKEIGDHTRCLITSRWTGELKKYIEQAIYIEIAANDEDINEYLRHEIKARSRLRLFVQKEPDFEDKIVYTILKNCKGMFLVARLHIEALSRKAHLRAAKLALEQLPATLDGVYENAIERIKSQTEEDVSLAWRVLTWIVGTLSPLTTEQLQHALAIEPGCDLWDEDALIDIDLILSVCAGLVVLDAQDSSVRLVHYTSQEFFDRRRSQLLPSTDCDIADACLQYLSFPETVGPCPTDEDLNRKLTSFPFLEYSAVNWGTHAFRCHCNDSELACSIEDFLDDVSRVAGAVQLMSLPASRHRGFSKNVSRSVHGLHLASHFGLMEIVEKRLLGGESQPRDKAGRTPLHWAARAGQVKVAKMLLKSGAEVDAEDKVNGTALHLASRFGHLEVVKVLLDHGADVNKSNTVGGTALIWSAIGGSVDITTLLLSRGADVRCRTGDGATPLLKAIDANNEGVVSILLQHDPELDALDSWRTPLMAATSKANEKIMRMLLEAGALPDFQNKIGTTALFRAVKRKTDGPTRLLLELGADPNRICLGGKTPLHDAARFGNLSIVSLLMPLSSLQAADDHGETVLHAAVTLRNEEREGEMIRFLLDNHQIDIDAIDTNGWSALTHATYAGFPMITQILLEAGANAALQALAIQALEESSPSLSAMERYSGRESRYSAKSKGIPLN